MGDSYLEGRADEAVRALLKAQAEVRRLDESLDIVASILSESPVSRATSTYLAIEQLRVARHAAESALRDAQEAADLVMDGANEDGLRPTRHGSGLVEKSTKSKRVAG